jgi:hypothetical protein
VTTVNNIGNAECRRWHLTLVPSATTVTFFNAAIDEPALVLVNVTGALVMIDGYGHNINMDGLSAYQLVAPGSGWPFLMPGLNTVTLTGATGTLQFNPVYI